MALSSILSLPWELDSCHHAPLSQETADFFILRLTGAIWYTHQVLLFCQRSPQFTDSETSRLPDLLVELQAKENLFRELPVFTDSSYKAPGLTYWFSWTAIMTFWGTVNASMVILLLLHCHWKHYHCVKIENIGVLTLWRPQGLLYHVLEFLTPTCGCGSARTNKDTPLWRMVHARGHRTAKNIWSTMESVWCVNYTGSHK